jgi:hypothetical protein
MQAYGARQALDVSRSPLVSPVPGLLRASGAEFISARLCRLCLGEVGMRAEIPTHATEDVALKVSQYRTALCYPCVHQQSRAMWFCCCVCILYLHVFAFFACERVCLLAHTGCACCSVRTCALGAHAALATPKLLYWRGYKQVVCVCTGARSLHLAWLCKQAQYRPETALVVGQTALGTYV